MSDQTFTAELTAVTTDPPTIASGYVSVDGQEVAQLYTGDFAPDDPWSRHMPPQR